MRCYAILCFIVAIFAYINAQGIPIKKCPPGEHSVLYCPPRAEPSCDNNTLHDLETPLPCDIPQCFCNKPTIRNVDTGECVDVNDCPSTC